ncbi:MAG: YbjQ family protein [Ferruginibacter sp.]|nr:YbjQ family protein [Ferruginibacter sp.]
MANPKDILVITTTSIDSIKVTRFLKPVSAHIVAGTNLLSDFFGGLTDVFGGRSGSYQKQLTSLYNEAIEQIRNTAHEIGANCVLGLRLDMDEISGKGKSMFMISAVGTAAIIESPNLKSDILHNSFIGLENISAERISILRKKKNIILEANAGTLELEDDTWDFIIANQIDEVFPYLLKKLSDEIGNNHNYPGSAEKTTKQLISYIDALPEQKKLDILYGAISTESNDLVVQKILEFIKNLNLYEFSRCMELLKTPDFTVQKRGVKIAAFDKSFYNKQDKKELLTLNNYIKTTFTEKGTRTTKKQLLSSKEKEVWVCGCGKTNEMDSHCSGCFQDIYGFKKSESNPVAVTNYIEQKIELISEFID